MMKKILVVDDEPNNLQLLRQILKDHYHLIFATSGKKALEAAKHQPDLVLLDIMMPEITGYEVCNKLKTDPLTKEIPVIFVTAMSEVEDEARGFEAGGVDYITKPVSPPVVLARVKTHLSLIKAESLDRLAKDSIIMLGVAGHYNDTCTGMHIWRMGAYSAALANANGWTEERVEAIQLAAPMHDMGKIGIPEGILKAPRKLTPEEWVTMKTHTTIGHEILKKSDNPFFVLAAEIALNHHEKWDGTGYPNELSCDAIPESAQIVALADVFDALTMKRPYKEAWPDENAFEEIKKGMSSHFSQKLVDTFFRIRPEILSIKAKFRNED